MKETKLKVIKWSILYWIIEMIIQLILMIVLSTNTAERWLWFNVWCSLWYALTAAMMIIMVVIFIKGYVGIRKIRNCTMILLITRVIYLSSVTLLFVLMLKTLTETYIITFICVFAIDVIGCMIVYLMMDSLSKELNEERLRLVP